MQIFYYFQSGVSLQNSLDLTYSQFDGIFIAAKVSKSRLFILFLHCRQANPGNGHSIKRRHLDLERCFWRSWKSLVANFGENLNMTCTFKKLHNNATRFFAQKLHERFWAAFSTEHFRESVFKSEFLRCVFKSAF